MPEVTPSELGRLIDEQGRALRLFAAQWTDEPEDVLQEAIIELASQPDRPHDPVSWLFGVVRNKARQVARGDRRRRQRERSARATSTYWFESSPDEFIDADVAAAALDRIDEQLREVIIARIWGDLTFEQIAEIVGSSSSTVHRRFVSGLEQLREQLGITWITNNTSTTT